MEYMSKHFNSRKTSIELNMFISQCLFQFMYPDCKYLNVVTEPTLRRRRFIIGNSDRFREHLWKFDHSVIPNTHL